MGASASDYRAITSGRTMRCTVPHVAPTYWCSVRNL
jgi:hypothetical protein